MGNAPDRGKLSLDMLIGLSIFLFTFIFVANFLPGIFADVRHEISLANQAYRVAALLVEDPGYPENWEEIVNITNCGTEEFRPGLARYDSGSIHYNELNLSKVLRLSELLNNATCRSQVKLFLGLDLTPLNSDVPLRYRINVSLTNFTGQPLTMGGSVLLKDGDPVPLSGQVIKFERLVYIDNSTAVDNCEFIADRCVAKLEVFVWT